MTAQTQDRADDLLRELGFSEWRPGQKEAVEAGLEGRDSLIVMPTGGG
jgi:superfamily II DNA helicase RecQ